MFILFLSPVNPKLTPGEPLPRWQMQASWVRALGRQGHDVRVVKYTPDDRIRLGWGERVMWNIRVIGEFREFGSGDLIIYSLGADVLWPQTLNLLKTRLPRSRWSSGPRNDGVKLVVLSGVSPILDGNPRERAMAPLIDLAATNDEGHAEEWLRLGAKRSVVLPIAGVDPELHFLRGMKEKRRIREFGEIGGIRDIDILFVGTVTVERGKFFDKLRRLLPKTVKMVVKEFVWEEDYAELMNRAKIGINLLRPEMKHGVNLRTFEIPALGAMEITSFCRPEWLESEKEVKIFNSVEEAADLVKRYLKDGKAREKIAAAGQERVMKEHTFDERAKKLMEMVDDDPRRHFFDTLGSESSLTSSSPPRKSESEVLSGSSSMVSKMPSSDYHGVRIDVSVCIVNYKVDKELARCLGSIKKLTKGVSYETIVIDNSADNRWYSGGNNLALKQAGGKYVLFLNPDCWLENDAIAELVNFMDKHPPAGAAEPRQVYESGEVAPTGSLLPKWWIDAVEMTGLSRVFGSVGRRGIIRELRVFREFRQSDKDRAKNWRTEVVSGAAMMVRREVLDKIGGFDENLKLFYTDVDLCRRIKRDGWEIWHVGEISVRHMTRGSTSKLPWDRLNLIYASDAKEYYRKWGEKIGGEILDWAMRGNIKIIKNIK